MSANLIDSDKPAFDRYMHMNGTTNSMKNVSSPNSAKIIKRMELYKEKQRSIGVNNKFLYHLIFLLKIFICILAILSIIFTIYCIIYTHYAKDISQQMLYHNLINNAPNSLQNDGNTHIHSNNDIWGIAWLNKVAADNYNRGQHGMVENIQPFDDQLDEKTYEKREEQAIKLLYAFLGVEAKQQQLESLLAQAKSRNPEDIYRIYPFPKKDFDNLEAGFESPTLINSSLTISENLTPPKLLKRIFNLLRIRKSAATQVKSLRQKKEQTEKDIANLLERVEYYKKSLKSLQEELMLINEKIQHKQFIKTQDHKPEADDFIKDTQYVEKLTAVIQESSVLLSKAFLSPTLENIKRDFSYPQRCTMDSCFDFTLCRPNPNLKINVYTPNHSKEYRELLNLLDELILNPTPSSSVQLEMFENSFFQYLQQWRSNSGAAARKPLIARSLGTHFQFYGLKLQELYPELIDLSFDFDNNNSNNSMSCADLLILPEEVLLLLRNAAAAKQLDPNNNINNSNNNDSFNNPIFVPPSFSYPPFVTTFLEKLNALPRSSRGSPLGLDNLIVLFVPILSLLDENEKMAPAPLNATTLTPPTYYNVRPIFKRALIFGNARIFTGTSNTGNKWLPGMYSVLDGPLPKFDVVTHLTPLLAGDVVPDIISSFLLEGNLPQLPPPPSNNNNQKSTNISYDYQTLTLNFPRLLPIFKPFTLGYLDRYALLEGALNPPSEGADAGGGTFIKFLAKFLTDLRTSYPSEYLIYSTSSTSTTPPALIYDYYLRSINDNCTFTLFLDDDITNVPFSEGGMIDIFPTPTTVELVLATLGTGSIPIILTAYEDPSSFYAKLPYSEQFDWSKALITIPILRVTELPELIKMHLLPSGPMLFELKKAGRHFRDYYFFRSHSRTVPEGLSVPFSPIEYLDHNLRATFTIFLDRLRAPYPQAKLIKTVTFPIPISDKAVVPSDYIEYLGPNAELWRNIYGSEDALRNFSFRSNLTCSMMDKPNPFNDIHKDLGVYHPSVPWDPRFPIDAKFYRSNYGFMPIGKGYGGSGGEFSKALGGNYPVEKFTIIMLTYKRETFLWSRLSAFLDLPYLDSIILVWNDLENEPSPELELPNIHAPIHIIKGDKNSLNNRFIPYDLIKTDAILSLDDDLSLRHDEIIFAFRVWRESRDRLVGFPARYHAWNETTRRWEYKSNHTCEYSMILTGAAFLHKYYFYKYTYEMAYPIRERIDQLMNCEDIAMNFLITHITQKPPIKVTVRWTFRCYDCPESLWYSGDHYGVRSECINYFTAIYGYNPLLYTQYRADSVLFKTRLPRTDTKCFKYV